MCGLLFFAGVMLTGMQGAVFGAAAVDAIAGIAPTLSQDGKSLILPESPDPAYTVSLYGSDNRQVVALDGSVIQPLVDTEVHIIYQLVPKTGGDPIPAKSNAKVTIPGKYRAESGDNPVPQVLPSLREWKGAQGQFSFTQNSRLVTAALNKDTAVTIQGFLTEMTGKTPSIAADGARSGDIELILDPNADAGPEGYLMEVGDRIVITSSTQKGLLYGGITVTQILYQDPEHTSVPKGTARDYPMYEKREGFIDVSRQFVEMDYLKEMTRYMAWFKLNAVQVYISCTLGRVGGMWRLESEKYPELLSVSGDQYYTKDEYREYQLEAQSYGMNVITIIPTPAHALAYSYVVPELMLPENNDFLDVSNPKTLEFVKDLYSEYLDGDNPVIQSDSFYLGCDEYIDNYNGVDNTELTEAFASYVSELVDYISDRGYKTGFWISDAAISTDVAVDTRAVDYYYDPHVQTVGKLYDYGFDIVNMNLYDLYIVPGGSGLCPDDRDAAELYNTFEVNVFHNSTGAEVVPLGHPQTLGACFGIFHDYRSGTTQYGTFERIKDLIFLVAEKTWHGAPAQNQSPSEFQARIDALSERVPFANPGREIGSTGDLAVNWDFAELSGEKVRDTSGNGYDGTVLHGRTELLSSGTTALVLDGEGYLSAPVGSVGGEYTVNFDIMFTANPRDAVLFEGPEGKMYFDKKGRLCYEQDIYLFETDITFALYRWVNVTLKNDGIRLYLYLDGRKAAEAMPTDGAVYQLASSAFVLQTQKMFSGVKGQVADFRLFLSAPDDLSDLIGYPVFDFTAGVDPEFVQERLREARELMETYGEEQVQDYSNVYNQLFSAVVNLEAIASNGSVSEIADATSQTLIATYRFRRNLLEDTGEEEPEKPGDSEKTGCGCSGGWAGPIVALLSLAVAATIKVRR